MKSSMTASGSSPARTAHGQNCFLDQAVVQVARAVEIDHVKVLK
jgi:hypothetical protein